MNRRDFLRVALIGGGATVIVPHIDIVNKFCKYFFAPKQGWTYAGLLDSGAVWNNGSGWMNLGDGMLTMEALSDAVDNLKISFNQPTRLYMHPVSVKQFSILMDHGLLK